MAPSDYLNSVFNLENKVAVVIGGTGELCGAMAEGLAAAGAETILVGRSEEKAAARLAKIIETGGSAYFEKVDVNSKASIQGLLDAVLAKSGKIDILINGAGVNSPTPIFDIEEDEFDTILNTNLKAVLFASQIFGKYLVERGEGGSIINIGSMSGIIPLSRVFTYSATKAAVHNLSKNLAREWAEQKVRVNTIVPGFFPAEQNKKVLNPERIASIMGHTPANRFGEAHAFARIRCRQLYERRGNRRRRRLRIDDDLIDHLK